MKLLFVGDPHLNSTTPISRLDNYRDVTINKLLSILQIAINEKVSTVVMTGDMFEDLDQSLIYMNRVLDALQLYKENNITIYSIVGNHDLPNDMMDKLQNSPLYTLFKSNLVKHLSTSTKVVLGDDTSLWGLDYTQLDKLHSLLVNTNEYNILVAHYAVDNTIPKDNIPFDDLKKFNLVVLGHDHHYYEPLKKGDTLFLRPGSMTRRTKEAFNLTREIPLYVFNTVSKEVSSINLPIEPAKDVFKNEIFNSRTSDFYGSSYSDIFNEDYFNSGSTDLSSIIDELPDTIEQVNKDFLKKYFNEQGLLKQES